MLNELFFPALYIQMRGMLKQKRVNLTNDPASSASSLRAYFIAISLDGLTLASSFLGMLT
jgi:hypothetical protein